MKNLLKKQLSVLLTVCMLVSAFAFSANAAEAESPAVSANSYGLAENIGDGAILHAWCWSFNTIKDNIKNIAEAGFSTVQTSPINEVIVGENGGMQLYGRGKWYYQYQPTNYKIGNYQLGTLEEFKAMCAEAHKYGIKVLVDAVVNHCSSNYSAISSDVKNIVRDIFLKTVSKANCESIDENEFIEMLFVELICERRLLVNSIKTRLEETEERILIKNTQESFNRELFEIKKELLEIRSFFEGIIDICDYFGRYDSDAFNICTSKAQRLKESAELLYQTAVQLWDCCQANTDMKLNSSMKTLTLVTTIFFPVTIIVGWYGMNFSSMPEISWRYGYIYVIALTVFVIVLVMAVFKRRKWF